VGSVIHISHINTKEGVILKRLFLSLILVVTTAMTVFAGEVTYEAGASNLFFKQATDGVSEDAGIPTRLSLVELWGAAKFNNLDLRACWIPERSFSGEGFLTVTDKNDRPQAVPVSSKMCLTAARLELGTDIKARSRFTVSPFVVVSRINKGIGVYGDGVALEINENRIAPGVGAMITQTIDKRTLLTAKALTSGNMDLAQVNYVMSAPAYSVSVGYDYRKIGGTTMSGPAIEIKINF
jgi:hypothetical protein